jgi:HAE1 family hydrophobic/amphiphilic exporter-1
MYALGFSLDNLSLLALTLAVGFVVDDAIVMLENIVRHIEAGEKPFDAAIKGAREIGFTIVSMTISLVAVFIPVMFMGGIIGRLLHEFAVTISAAILVSGLVSLTLTPMLASRYLRQQRDAKHNKLYWLFERFFDALLNGYRAGLGWSLAHPRLILATFFVTLVASIALYREIPKDFLPSGDSGQILAYTEGAPEAAQRAADES